MNKFLPGPENTETFTPSERKYKSPAHKKIAKLEKRYESAEGKPLLQERILRSAMNFGKHLRSRGVIKAPV